ncbi:MAG: hypothetical protein JNJ83_20845 [Verrucomicrobiaceae bacterium]|nr:hypothetical protein [Verrucomicrobiaceae bacterium]
MKTIQLPAWAASFALATSLSFAGTSTPCDKIAQDVRDAVAKDPSKVLMQVEDALVINESCACEIVKAAIAGANADAELTKQIVETAVAVAPKMTAVIQECAAGGTVEQPAVASGKNGAGKNANAFTVQPPKEDTSTTDFNQGGRIDIRGIYLSMPAAGGFLTTDDLKDHDEHDDSGKGGRTRTKIIRERKIIIVPVSPTRPDPKK